jgi:hypothetical protein
MRKQRFVGLRLDESTFNKLKAISGDRTITNTIVELIEEAYSGAKKEAQSFQNLISSIDRLNQQIAMQSTSKDREGFLVILDALKVLAQYLVVMQDRRTELMKLLDQLKERIS